MDAVRRRELARVSSRSRCTASIDDVEQPRHLARMRRDDHVDAVASHQPVGLAGKRVQRVGVEHQRHAGALEQRLHERRRARRLAEPRPDGDHVGLELEHALDRAKSIVPAGVSSSGSVMYSGAIAATIGTHDRGVAT